MIILNVLYAKKEKIYPAYVSKRSSNRKKQFAVKKLPALLRGITSKHHCDFYCLKCLHSFTTKNKRESQEISM